MNSEVAFWYLNERWLGHTATDGSRWEKEKSEFRLIKVIRLKYHSNKNCLGVCTVFGMKSPKVFTCCYSTAVWNNYLRYLKTFVESTNWLSCCALNIFCSLCLQFSSLISFLLLQFEDLYLFTICFYTLTLFCLGTLWTVMWVIGDDNSRRVTAVRMGKCTKVMIRKRGRKKSINCNKLQLHLYWNLQLI